MVAAALRIHALKSFALIVLSLALPVGLIACTAGPQTVVSPPSQVRVLERDSAVEITWEAVPGDGIGGYRIFFAPAEPANAQFELAREVDAATTSATIEGLTNFVAYRFAVRTVSEDGVSELSPIVLGAPFSVAATPLVGFEIDEGGTLAVLADGSRYRLHSREEMTTTDGPEPPELDPASLGPASAVAPLADALPDRFTLAAYQTPIRNQGRRGTCQTFATIAAMEAEYRDLGLGTFDLSEQFATHIYRQSRLREPPPATAGARENTLGMRGGGNTGGVLSTLMHYRIPLETAAPYIGVSGFEDPNQAGDVPRIDPGDDAVKQIVYNDWNLQDAATAFSIPTPLTFTPFPREALTDAEYGVTGFARLPTNLQHDPALYEQQLVNGNEIVFGFCFNGGSSDADGVWRPGSDDACGGHAVLLIGYDRTDPDDPVFIAKNSWGGSAYQLLDYEFVTESENFLSAHVVTGVRDPGRGNVLPQVALGRWDLIYDGSLATLDINRLPGYYQASQLGGLQDRRLGLLTDDLGDSYRVNGAVDAANLSVEFHVDFAAPEIDYETLSGTHFTGYVSRWDPLFMAGTFVTPSSSETAGFYAHKDGPVPSVLGGPADEPQSYLGTWTIMGLDVESHLVVTEMLSNGVFTGVTTHDRTSVSGRFDLIAETLSFPLVDGAGISGDVLAYLHNDDAGTASGTFTRGANTSGIAVIRSADEPSVEIDLVGVLRQDGDVELRATAADFVDPAEVSIEWSYQLVAGGASTDFGSSASAETFTANLPCADLLVTARATDSSRGLSAHDVAAVSCAPQVETRGFHADRDLSGWVNSNGKVGSASFGDVLLVGDDAFDHGYRSYLTFDWNLPQDLASIEEATVTFFVDSVTGDINQLGNLRAVHADYGDTLDAGDYTGFTPLPVLLDVPIESDEFGSFSFDVTAAMREAWDDRASRGERLQLVLYFSVDSDDDGLADQVTILAEDEPGTTLLPLVTIEYRNY
ncbi:MAG: fibronectin type III domain-containing protein [Trueperaceae bacterium]|nr:fibronectin type III domain-containing protein [Trueperaceae bacterium]